MAAVAGVGGAGGGGEGENKDPVMMRQDSTPGVLDIDPALAEAAVSNSASRRRKQQGNMAQRLWRALRGQQNPLPSANPKNWPEPTIEDVLERPTRIVQINKSQEYSFCDNFIKTSKYEVWSFMPKFLAMEFHPRKKIANLYFLIVSSMQAIPAITSTFGYPILLMPLLFIVLIDMIFTIIEDASRHKADALANASRTVVLDKGTGKWIVKERWEVAVGDFVKIHNREEVPADMVVVGVHERYRPNCSGACYVETKSLDGETNLKIRQVQKVLLGRVDGHKDLDSFSGRIIMEHPNKAIASFTGSLEVSLRPGGGAAGVGVHGDVDGAANSTAAAGGGVRRKSRTVVKEPVTPENLLLRGTVLRNTKWAVGLVISTGHDTKVMMSIAKAPEKSSHLNTRVNTEIKGLALMLFLFCLTGAMGSSIWQSAHDVFRAQVLMLDTDLVADFVVQFFYYLLLLYGFVPISLYVSQNFIRFFQAWFMDQDLDMYHEATDTPSRVRTMNLNEDLGQITHVFSDKTGTLTQNVMDFRKCTVGGRSYGKGMTEIGQAALKLKGVELSQEELSAEQMAQEFAAPHVNFYDPVMFRDLQAETDGGDGTGPLTEFLTVLALCHTVIPERPNDSDEIVLSASSPDDEALVLGAKYFGVEFTERIDTTAIIRRTPMPSPLSPSGDSKKEAYDVLRILGFNSVRKRMSVVVRGPDGKVKVLAKGADTTMVPLLREDTPKELLDTTMDQLEGFALEGLRTLMVGVKDFSEEDFEAWDEAYDAAINDLTEVAEQQAGRPNRIDDLMAQAERGLTLIGGTAIEDKLQTGVGETIEKMVRGGMVVWVITGDKEETAINIGVACQLLWAEDRMDRCIINTKTCPTPTAVKNRLVAEFERYCDDMTLCKKNGQSCKPRCLVIDGAAFSLIEDAPLTSLHGPLEGEPSLMSLVSDSPSMSMSMSQTQRADTAETPSRLKATTYNARWRKDRQAAASVLPRSSSKDLNFDLSANGSAPLSSGGRASAASATEEDAMEGAVVASFSSGSSDVVGSPTRLSPGGDNPFLGNGNNPGRTAVAVGVPSHPGGAAGSPAGDEKQENEGGVSWGLSSSPAGEYGGGVATGGDVDEEAGGGKGGDKDQVVEVILDAGDALTAKEALLQFASVCQAFVGCRMSPDQKRQLVHLIKDNNPDARTLAVGDGANDVPMIQAAHVGVGISGQEGLQAVNASDYSLAQFRFLQKLLLCHGRFNYRRMSFATSYLFYKSVSWAVPLFIYAFFNGLSGQFFYDWVNSMLWALLYTGLPIVLLGVYDMDVLPSTALRYPWLYRNGVDDELLTKKFFWGWIAQGVFESCWVTIPLIFLQMGGPEFKGETPSVLGFGHTAFQSMTLVVNMKLLFVQRRWHWVEAALLTVSTALLFIMSWVLNISVFVTTQLNWEWFGVQSALFKDPNYWAVTIFGVIGVLMRDVAWKGYHRWWNPKLHHVLVEMEKGHLEDIDLPRSLRRSYSLHQVIQEDTSTRVSKMRTQSIQRMEDHRDAVIQALGASGSGKNYQAASPDNNGPDASARARRNLDAVVNEGGRPRSAGGRLTSISSMLEGLSRSPMSTQLSTTGSNRRGRSAGSSPILPGMMAFAESSALPNVGGRGEGVVVRYRSSGDLSLMGREGSDGGGGGGGTAWAKAGFAFSHDEAASHRQIEMIMRNRPSHTRRRSMQPASKLPAIDDTFQAHLRALKDHNAAIVADTNTDGGSGDNGDVRGGQVAASGRASGHDNSAGSSRSRSFSLADSSFEEDGEVGGLAVVQEHGGDDATAIAPAATAAAATARLEDGGDDATAVAPAAAAASLGNVDGAMHTGDTAGESGNGEEQQATASVGDVDCAIGDDSTAVAPTAAASVRDDDAGTDDTAGVSSQEQQSKRTSLRDVLSSLLSGNGTAGTGGHSNSSDGDGGNRRESASSLVAVVEPPDESE